MFMPNLGSFFTPPPPRVRGVHPALGGAPHPALGGAPHPALGGAHARAGVQGRMNAQASQDQKGNI